MSQRLCFILVLVAASGCSRPAADQEQIAATSIASLDDVGIETPDLQHILDATVGSENGANGTQTIATLGQISGLDGTVGSADGIVEISCRYTPGGKPEVVGLGINYSEADDAFVARLGKIQTLQSLKIENGKMTIEGIRSLVKRVDLQQLCIAKSNANISDDEVEDLNVELSTCRVFRDLSYYNPHL